MSLSCATVFFNSLTRSRYLSIFSHSFTFTQWSAGTENSTIWQDLSIYFYLFIFLVDYYKVWSSGRDLVIVDISKSQRTLCVSFSRADAGLCIYHLFIRSNSNFLHNSKWITFSTQLCLVLYSFSTDFLHSLM